MFVTSARVGVFSGRSGTFFSRFCLRGGFSVDETNIRREGSLALLLGEGTCEGLQQKGKVSSLSPLTLCGPYCHYPGKPDISVSGMQPLFR